MRRHVALIFALLVADATGLDAQIEGIAGQPVRIMSADGLTLHGDLYTAESGPTGPVIVLFHQAGSNARGEYRDIVPGLVANGYNALAVDLRTGGSSRHGDENRTVAGANLPESSDYCGAYPDVLAAWQFIVDQGFTGPRFAWGSSFSAALVIRLAAERGDEMSGVLAFSPASGEPMAGCQPEQYIAGLTVPALILRPEAEAEIERVAAQLRQFEAAGHRTHIARPGTHGSSMLDASRVEGDTAETWRVVLDYLRSRSTAR